MDGGESNGMQDEGHGRKLYYICIIYSRVIYFIRIIYSRVGYFNGKEWSWEIDVRGGHICYNLLCCLHHMLKFD